jgi:hypothetical protein
VEHALRERVRGRVTSCVGCMPRLDW